MTRIIIRKMQNLFFERLSAKKDATVSVQKKENVKRIRDEVKKELGNLTQLFF